MGGDARVEEETIDRLDVVLGEERREPGVVGGEEREAPVKVREALARVRESFRVTVGGVEEAIGSARIEDGVGVPCPTERGVEVASTRRHIEPVEDLMDHDGGMIRDRIREHVWGGRFEVVIKRDMPRDRGRSRGMYNMGTYQCEEKSPSMGVHEHLDDSCEPSSVKTFPQ